MPRHIRVKVGGTEVDIPVLTDEESRLESSWILDTLRFGLPPVPKFQVRCPQCGETELIYFKCYRVFQRALNQYRCDVWFKCGKCYYTWVHGVHISEEIYRDVLAINKLYGDWTTWGGHILVKEAQRRLGLLR